MTQKNTEKKSKFVSGNTDNAVFNRSAVRRNRNRAAAKFDNHDFLVKEITARLIDNLQDIRKDFQHILSVHADPDTINTHFKNSFVIHQDLSAKMLKHKTGMLINAEEEFFPLKNQCLDLIISCLSLHWANDLPGVFIQFLRSLMPDGLFLGALFGGETLKELRQAMIRAEMEIRGGISPHISPFPDVRDAGALLQRAGFALPVVSTEKITVTYQDALSLMKDLKAMGEQNSLIKRFKGLTRPELMMRAAEIYQQDYANDEGRINATFEILYLQGWAPHENQQKPLKPGSAKMSLKDALGTKPPKS
jgi:NADH dehydrogenase [ubiquinone] 1 alpha subcomplex assembly factor 5